MLSNLIEKNMPHTGGCALYFHHFKADGYPHILLFPVILPYFRAGINAAGNKNILCLCYDFI